MIRDWKDRVKQQGPFFLFLVFILFRGGYFYHESLLFLGVAMILLLASYYYNQKEIIHYGQASVLPFLYLLFYSIPLFWADNMHIVGVFKLMAPIALVIALLQFYDVKTLLEQFFQAYVYSLLLAFVVLGLQHNLSHTPFYSAWMEDYFVTLVIQKRFTGWLQYANVNAVFSLITGFYFIRRKDKHWKIILSALSLGLSGSRTAWILTIVLLIYVAGYLLYQKEWKKETLYRIFSFVCFLSIGIWLVSLWLKSGRIGEGLQASEFQTRLLYYKDGLFMILKNPLGYGHYGYYLIQRQFQTGSMYFIKYIHNFWLQIILDGGVVTGFLFLALLLKTAYFLWMEKSEKRTLYLPLFLTFLAHAFFDFDLEFSYSYLFIWLVYFAAFSGERKKIVLHRSYKSLFFAGNLILLSISFFLALIFIQVYFGNYRLAADLGFTDAKMKILKSVETDEEIKREIAHSMEKNQLKSPETFAFLRDYYYNKGNLKKAIGYGRQAVELAPLLLFHRQELMRIEYAYALLNSQDMSEVAEDILGLPQRLSQLKVEKSTQLNVQHRPQWEMSKEMQLWYLHFRSLYQGHKE